jgi:gamma-aminobutyric acid receptor subunit beta
MAPGLEIAGYTFEFHATRLGQYYLLKVILPLLLIVMMSWTVFWIDPTNGGPQISVAVTSMLTLIAYRFAIGSEVPKLPYLTRLDAFILASSILVFLSLIEVMLTTKLATDNRIDLARTIDRRCRIFFPLTFIGASAAIFLR